MSEDLKNKVHELEILTEELSTLRPKASVYARRVPSSKLLFLENRAALADSKKQELTDAKAAMAAIPGQHAL
ncbi:hypothetical protein KVV02_003673 [Mortierella alpina]|uniref:Uncharacterized protein n=1 Tax=Mortierella alpina TaxID=64518 RepID=A0A9P7ZYS6_MORAP|nr:hypothetical protein KVV02_003673 [Mortierella alpina]